MRYLALFLILTLSLFAEHIENYTTQLVVKNSSNASIVEIIDYDFGYTKRRGIYKDIPKNGFKIKNIKVKRDGINEPFELFTKDRFWRLKIGDKNIYLSGKKEYKISYNLEGPVVKKDGNKNKIIFDIIGTRWNKPIKNAKGIIYLPKELQNNIIAKAFRGRFGSTKMVPVKNLGTHLEIETKNLKPNEGLTVSIAFEPSLMAQGKEASYKYYKQPIYYLFLAPILGLFWFFGKRLNVFGDIGSIAPKYRPPKDLTVMEAGLIKDNFVDFKEIKPAILELANLGYLKMEEDGGEIFLIKQKEPDAYLTQTQRDILNDIFSISTEVPSRDLKIKKTTFETIKERLHYKLVDSGYYATSVKSSRESFLFASVGIGLLMLGGFFYYITKDTGIEAIFPMAIALGFIGVGVINLIGAFKSRNFSSIFFFIIWIVFSSFFLFTAIGSKDIALSLFFMILIVIIGSYIIYKKANTLTFKGILAKRHLLGLKEFIDKADKDKIAYFLKEDKKYLDKMLPYAVLFGLNKHWLELYQELDAPMPDWYYGNYFDLHSFDFEPSIYSPNSGSFSDGIGSGPSIDMGDFGGFGDFSGGGFGGGGGDSW